MNLKGFGKLNSRRFLHEAFDAKHRKKLLQAARLRRNVYIVLFFIGFACIFVAGFIEEGTLCCLSLFLTTLSLVVVSKYDTQVFFLKILDKQEETND